MISAIPLFAFPFCLLAAALTDAQRYIIPNKCSLGLIAGFLVAFAFSGLGLHDLGMHVATGAAMLVIGFALFAFNLCGAGDSKLLAAVGLWLGPMQFSIALLYIGIAGGLLALIMLMPRFLNTIAPYVVARFEGLKKLAETDRPDCPYGVAIAAGALLAFPQTQLYIAVMGL